MPKVEFLPFDPLATRQLAEDDGLLTVLNILRSYHSNYDLFAELVQNAVDATHMRWRDGADPDYHPEITVFVNLADNSVAVLDNGTGIGPEDCRSIFAPNFSLKA